MKTTINPALTASSIVDIVGNTPLVEIKRLNPNPAVKLYAKLEGQNPAGSVKDRPVLSMVRGALERGEITDGTTLVEATSGNTGIAMSMVCSTLGIPLELIMPANATPERIHTMRAYGAKVTLTPAEQSMEGAIDLAREKAAQDGYAMLNQFGNPDNWKGHYRTTGPEVWEATQQQVTHFVSAMGTTGTIMGTSRYLKEQNPSIQIVGTQPTEGSRIPGIRRWPKAYLPAIFEPERVDRIIDVSQEQAMEMARLLASKEGIFSGMSSGGAACAALQVVQELTEGVVVFIVCDRGDRYLSSPLFRQDGD